MKRALIAIHTGKDVNGHAILNNKCYINATYLFVDLYMV